MIQTQRMEPSTQVRQVKPWYKTFICIVSMFLITSAIVITVFIAKPDHDITKQCMRHFSKISHATDSTQLRIGWTEHRKIANNIVDTISKFMGSPTTTPFARMPKHSIYRSIPLVQPIPSDNFETDKICSDLSERWKNAFWNEESKMVSCSFNDPYPDGVLVAVVSVKKFISHLNWIIP